MFLKLFLTLSLTLISLGDLGAGATTRFTLCARTLPNTDGTNEAPDTYVQIFYAPTTDAPLEPVGETKINFNNQNPDWPEIFSVPNNGDSTQYLKFVVLDADDPDVGDELIGEITVTLSRVQNQPDRVLWTDLWQDGAWRGSLVVKVQKEEEEEEEDCSSVTCPEDVNDMYFPHPSKCNAFCQCSNGIPIEMPCAPGTVFDPNLDVCVHPDQYDCPLKVVPY